MNPNTPNIGWLRDSLDIKEFYTIEMYVLYARPDMNFARENWAGLCDSITVALKLNILRIRFIIITRQAV